MNHKIVFEDAQTGWESALPLGNGRFGAMVFYECRTLHIALNHYDWYYSATGQKQPRRTYAELCDAVFAARAGESFARSHYEHTLNPQPPQSRPAYTLASYPMAGELLLPVKENPTHFSLVLDIEAATVTFCAEGPGWQAGAKLWVAQTADCLFAELTGDARWGTADLIIPSGRGLGNYSGQAQFETVFATVAGCLAAAVTPLGNRDDNIKQLGSLITRKDMLRREHAAYWSAPRATVTLPDRFLETLWHLHLYVMECASGIGGKYPGQACGLNGLWDIRRPVLWPSQWYWDVNIQMAFWPVFSANRPELAKHFCHNPAGKLPRLLLGLETHALFLCVYSSIPWRAHRVQSLPAVLRIRQYG